MRLARIGYNRSSRPRIRQRLRLPQDVQNSRFLQVWRIASDSEQALGGTAPQVERPVSEDERSKAQGQGCAKFRSLRGAVSAAWIRVRSGSSKRCRRRFHNRPYRIPISPCLKSAVSRTSRETLAKPHHKSMAARRSQSRISLQIAL